MILETKRDLKSQPCDSSERQGCSRQSLMVTGDLLQRLLRGDSFMTVFLPSSQYIQQPDWICKSSCTHQSLAVQQGCPALAACSPFGKSDHVVQLPHQRVDIFLLLLQIWVVVLSQSLTTNLSMSLHSLSTSYTVLMVVIRTSKWFSRILPFLLISIIKLQMDFFISFVTDFRFSSTCWSLKKIPAEHNLNLSNTPGDPINKT